MIASTVSLCRSSHRVARRAFTLTELLVAIAVLVGVLLAASKIFSTTSRVSSMGEAATNVLQDVGAIERRIRDDFEKITREGVLAIRCVAVPNDINLSAGFGGLLQPTLPPEAMIRCDQILFFANGRAGSQNFVAGESVGANRKSAATLARIYYGHAFQLGPEGRPADPSGGVFKTHDINQPVFPWTVGEVDMVRTAMEGASIFGTTGGSTAAVTPFDSRKWLFVRHPVMMADDVDGDDTLYLGEVRTGRSLFFDDPITGNAPELQKGRLDATSMQLNDLQRRLRYIDEPPTAVRPWVEDPPGADPDQYTLIGGIGPLDQDGLLYYPRAERYAPSMFRVDQSLTNNVLLSACSQVRIDWCWEEGVGSKRDAFGNIEFAPGLDGFIGTNDDAPLSGLLRDHAITEEMPWFGLSDDVLFRDEERRGVFPMATWQLQSYIGWETGGSQTIFPDNIERVDNTGGVETYTAFFGFNQNDLLDPFTGNPLEDLGYTPWPTAIRFTLTLHDPKAVLEAGRDVQFVVRLPRRHER